MTVREFVKKNLVVMVMVPAIIASHYGWYKLQEIEALVSPEDRGKLPFQSLFQKEKHAEK